MVESAKMFIMEEKLNKEAEKKDGSLYNILGIKRVKKGDLGGVTRELNQVIRLSRIRD